MIGLTQAQLDQLYVDWTKLGADREQARIIKLLENEIEHDWTGSEPCEACDQTDYLIALIKGKAK